MKNVKQCMKLNYWNFQRGGGGGGGGGVIGQTPSVGGRRQKKPWFHLGEVHLIKKEKQIVTFY